MLKNIVLITIENFNREYNGKNLLSRELVKKGFIVFLGHKSIIRLIAKFLKLKNCIFIDKGNRKAPKRRLKLRYRDMTVQVRCCELIAIRPLPTQGLMSIMCNNLICHLPLLE